MTELSQLGRMVGMSCTIRVSPHEEMEITLERWARILDILDREREISGKRRDLKGYQVRKKELLKAEIKKARGGEAEAIKSVRKKLYTPLDYFIVYLNEKWDMAFETYQVLEFIFRASMGSHERALFDYGPNRYATALKDVRGTAREKYEQILRLTQKFSDDCFFGLEDLYPTKTEYVKDLNKELQGHISRIQNLQRQLEKEEDKNSPLYAVVKELQKTASGLETWAFGRVLGQEQNRGFLSFRDGQIVMDHKNFLYFKIYILVFMGTYGEFAHRVFPDRNNLVCQLAEKKLKFESGRHFDDFITPRFLSGRERYADQDRNVENIPQERGFLDDDLLTYIVEQNSELLMNGELPFHLVKRIKSKRPA